MTLSTDPQFRLSEHFTLKEFIQSQTAVRLKIENSPSNIIVVRLKRLCEHVLEPLREALGPVIISSGYRSVEVNRAVGGSIHSSHTLGEAADINVVGHTDEQVRQYIMNHLPFDQLINEYPPNGWTHVSYREANNRHQHFRIG